MPAFDIEHATCFCFPLVEMLWGLTGPKLCTWVRHVSTNSQDLYFVTSL